MIIVLISHISTARSLLVRLSDSGTVHIISLLKVLYCVPLFLKCSALILLRGVSADMCLSFDSITDVV